MLLRGTVTEGQADLQIRRTLVSRLVRYLEGACPSVSLDPASKMPPPVVKLCLFWHGNWGEAVSVDRSGPPSQDKAPPKQRSH